MTPQTPVAESSPAPVVNTTFEVPQGEARAEWLKTGNVPEPKPKGESAPPKESSAEGDKPEGKGAPAPEAGNKQERRSNAETRLNEVLEDLRRAGLSPSELKSFKREQQQATEPKTSAPEKTANPVDGLKAPVKPKFSDFEGKPWSEWEDARDKYAEDFADYKSKLAIQEYRDQQKQESVQKDLQSKLDGARQRYGDEADQTIGKASGEIFSDDKINGVVKTLMNDSPVLVDLLYVIGKDAGDMADFLHDARSNPGAAIRKLVLIEAEVMKELAGSSKANDSTDEPARGEGGKFVKAAPEKKLTEAPPPPKEVSGRSAAPPDEVDQALKTGDARAAIDAMNRADLRRRKGL